MTQEERFKQLRLKALPINTLSGMFVDANGVLQQIDFKLKAVEEDRTIEGYLSVFGVRDSAGEVTVKGCFAKSIKERGPASNSKYKIVFLWMHDMCDPIGQFLELKEDDYGLYFKAQLDPVENGDRCLIQVKSGTINQFSFGYDYIWDKMRYDEATDSIMLLELELYEGSAVTLGCNMETYAIKSAEDILKAKEDLEYETEGLIKSLPLNKRLEIKHLISKHIALATIEPRETEAQRLEALKQKQAATIFSIGGYTFDTKQMLGN